MGGLTRIPPPPPASRMDRLTSVVAPLARVTQPQIEGIERVPDDGALFVGNHTIYSFLDIPFMIAELWDRRGIAVRGLGDHRHYAVPVWRELLERGGMVRGTRENVRALMSQRESILVFPGGAEEVFKQRGEKYKLKWKERLGFARLAIEFGYPIVPFAAVGAEEMLDVVADDGTPVVGQVSNLMKRLVGLPLPPITRGIGPTPFPRPERLYFWFGKPIETERFSGIADDASARGLRDEVRDAVESGIARLLQRRETDPRRGLRARLRTGDDPLELPEDPKAAFVTRAFDAWNTAGADGAAAWLARSVELADPPEWPDSDTWHGRDAALARLEDVTSSLGGSWAEVTSARSSGDQVLVSMKLRTTGEPNATEIGEFHLASQIANDQIQAIRVFLDRKEAEACAA